MTVVSPKRVFLPLPGSLSLRCMLDGQDWAEGPFQPEGHQPFRGPGRIGGVGESHGEYLGSSSTAWRKRNTSFLKRRVRFLTRSLARFALMVRTGRPARFRRSPRNVRPGTMPPSQGLPFPRIGPGLPRLQYQAPTGRSRLSRTSSFVGRILGPGEVRGLSRPISHRRSSWGLAPHEVLVCHRFNLPLTSAESLF